MTGKKPGEAVGSRLAQGFVIQLHRTVASWRSGYAEDCKSLHPGSIPGEASKFRNYRK
jgi:hypothetical protein